MYISIGNTNYSHPQKLHQWSPSRGKMPPGTQTLGSRVSCLCSWCWARFESRGPLRLIYSDDKIPQLCLFIFWQHIGKAISSEEQPARAEVGAKAGETWSSPRPSATDLLCGPDKLQMAPHLTCPAVVAHKTCSAYIMVMILLWNWYEVLLLTGKSTLQKYNRQNKKKKSDTLLKAFFFNSH